MALAKRKYWFRHSRLARTRASLAGVYAKLLIVDALITHTAIITHTFTFAAIPWCFYLPSQHLGINTFPAPFCSQPRLPMSYQPFFRGFARHTYLLATHTRARALIASLQMEMQTRRLHLQQNCDEHTARLLNLTDARDARLVLSRAVDTAKVSLPLNLLHPVDALSLVYYRLSPRSSHMPDSCFRPASTKLTLAAESL